MIAATSARRRRRSKRSSLLYSSALIGMAGAATLASGQSFQAGYNVAGGSVSVTRGPGTDTITVNSATAVIDWQASGNASTGAPIEFQSANTTATFQGASDFTVLNRIGTANSNPVEFLGTVRSTVAGARGGAVWFYSPDGIILGNGAAFNVGSLILTTNEIATGNGTQGETVPSIASGVSFARPDSDPGSIVIQPGASITAPQPGSYVALISPTITQGGTVNVNGSTGYIAASAATVTINAGLFTITNAIGTDIADGGSAQPITHTGTTGGPAATATGTPHRIYLATVPANDAVTMLVQGSLGYQPAASASVENGRVYLLAGYLPDGSDPGELPGRPVNAGPGDISITSGTITSPAVAFATRDTRYETTAGNIGLAGLLSVADRDFVVHVTNGNRIDSSGDFDAQSYRPDATTTLSLDVDANGTLAVAGLLEGARRGADGQRLTLNALGTVTAGDLNLTTSSFPTAAAATGGTTTVDVAGGSLTVANDARIAALGFGGVGTGGNQLDSTGGSAIVTVSAGGTASFNNLRLDVAAASPSIGTVSYGGTARGGTATIAATGGGTITVAGALAADATAVGSTTTAGAATTAGGAIAVTADGGTIRQTGTTTAIMLDARADGGTASGGTVRLRAQSGGTLTMAGAATLTTAAAGAVASGTARGDATGGGIAISADAATLSMTGPLAANSAATASIPGSAAPTGGSATGGAISLTADNNGRLTLATLGGAQFDSHAAATATTGSSNADFAGTGGAWVLTANHGGGATLGATTIATSAASANGSATPGEIAIRALADAPPSTGTAAATPITLASLAATANAPAELSNAFLIAADKPVTITGDANFSGALSAAFDASGAGSITVGGNLTVAASFIESSQTNGATGVNPLTVGSGTFTAVGDIGLPSLVATGTVSASTANGTITIGSPSALHLTSVVAAGNVLVTSAGALTVDAGSSTDGRFTMSAGGTLTTGAIDAYFRIDALASGALSTTSLTSRHSFLNIQAGQNADVTAASAGDGVGIMTGGPLTAGTLTAGTDPTGSRNDGSIDFGRIGIRSVGSVTVGSATAYGSVGLVSTQGGVSATSLVAGSGSPIAGQSGAVAVLTAGDVGLGSVAAPRFLYVGNPSVAAGLSAIPNTADVIQAIAAAGPTRAGGDVTIGSASAGNAQIGAAGGLSITSGLTTVFGADPGGTVTADAALDAGGALEAGTLAIGDPALAGGSLTATAGTIAIGQAQVGLDTTLLANGAVSVGTLATERDGDIRIPSTVAADVSTVTLGNVTIGDDFRVETPGSVQLGTLDMTGADNGTPQGGPAYPGNSLLVNAGSLDVQSATLANGTVDATASAGAINFGSLATRNADDNADGHVALKASGMVVAGGLDVFGTVSATGSGVSLTSTTADLRLADVVASTGSVSVTSGGAIDVQGNLDAPVATTLSASGDISGGNHTFTGGFSAVSKQGAVTFGALTAGNATTGGGIQLAGKGGVTTGDLRAYNTVSLVSGATLTAGNAESIGGLVRATAANAMTIGNVRAAGSIFLTGGGTIAAGDLTAGTGPLLPSEQGMAVGSIDPTTGGLAPGFDQFAFEQCLDCARGAALPQGFAPNFFGTSYTTAYISDHGYFTFDSAQNTFTPSGLGMGYAGQPIIAAYFADADLRNSAPNALSYGAGTFAGRQAFGATWRNVGYYSEHNDKQNSFQLILTNRADTGAGNFDIYYNYTGIQWEAGDDSNGVNGLGGISAAVGYNAGTGNAPGTYFELPGSRVPGSFLDSGTAPLIATTNNGVAGQLFFAVRNGQVVSNVSEPATVHLDTASMAGGAITTGAISAEAVDAKGGGAVTTGAVSTGDRGSGIAAKGEAFTTAIAAAGPVATGPIDSTGTVTLAATGGDVSAASIATRSAVNVSATGAIELAGVDATGAVSATAGGLLALAGPVAGQTVALTSGDIAIAGGATVGDARTASATFTNGGQSRTFVGDGTAATASDYTLDSGELGRVHAGSIAITGAGVVTVSPRSDAARRPTVGAAATGEAALADLTIGDLTLAGGPQGNLTAADGTLSFTTSGAITLVGRVALTGAAAGNAIQLNSGDAITGVLPSAGIAITDASGALAGSIGLSGYRILFATNDAAGAVASATSTTAIGDRLSNNDGNSSTDGYLRADSVRFTVGRSLYTQNSGASAAIADRAGVTAGAGGIAIAALGGAQSLDIVLNGRLANPVTTGADLVGAVRTASGGAAALFSAGSTINGCPASGSSCGTTPPPGGNPITPMSEQINRMIQPVQDVVQQVTLPSGLGNAAAYSFDTPTLISLVDLAPLTSAPLIDGPVTGAGNDDLWVGVGVGKELAPMGGAKKDAPQPK